MSTLRSFKIKLQVSFAVVFALILLGAILGNHAVASVAADDGTGTAARAMLWIALAATAGLAFFTSRAIGSIASAMSVIVGCAKRLSAGEVPETIEGTFQGEFQTLKGHLNSCINGLGGLVEAKQVLQRMAANDHTVKVAGEYPGIFAEVAAATNLALDRVKAANLACTNVAKGDYKANLEQFKKVGKRSENDTFIPGFIEMMEAIDALVHDAQELSAAAVRGDLQKRADPSKHQGEYRKVVQGLNDTLEGNNTASEHCGSIRERYFEGRDSREDHEGRSRRVQHPQEQPERLHRWTRRPGRGEARLATHGGQRSHNEGQGQL